MVTASAEVLKAINSPRTRIERIRLLRWISVYEVKRLSRGELGSRTSRRIVTDQACCTDRLPNLSGSRSLTLSARYATLRKTSQRPQLSWCPTSRDFVPWRLFG